MLHGSYLDSDISFLLNVLDKKSVANTDPATKETLIQSGQKHYSQMLTLETAPSTHELSAYAQSLADGGERLAVQIHDLAHTLSLQFKQETPLILVSLVRAGVPVGVLLQRAFTDPTSPYHRACHHYGVSIIRDKGIDTYALDYITKKHPNCPIVFVDGWTGKGAIFQELSESLNNFCANYPHTRSQFYHQGQMPPLVVLNDPADVAWLSASRADELIISSLLNSTISGLVSRTLWQADGFHGCVIYDELAEFDQSVLFVNHIHALRQSLPNPKRLPTYDKPRFATRGLIERLGREFGIDNPNRIKPTIAEATRAIIRREPERVLLAQKNKDTALLRQLCEQKNIPITIMDIAPYQAITLIKKRH